MNKKAKIMQKCMVFNKNELLIIQRAKKDSAGGTWEFPGGNLDFLEKLDTSIKRELKEEIGMNIKKINRVGMSEVIVKKLKKHFLVFFCSAKINSKKIKLSEEHDDYKWIDAQDLFNYDLNPVLKYSKDELKRILKEKN